jgi:hypothetical protein
VHIHHDERASISSSQNSGILEILENIPVK